MHSPFVFALLSPAIASAAILARASTDALQSFCSCETSVITKLKLQSTATAFCSSYLRIPTSTVTSTSTITPACTISTITISVVTSATSTSAVTIPATVYSITQITNTVTSTETTSTTLTTSTSSITCLDSAFSASAPDGTLAKRGTTSTVSKPSAIPKSWAPSLISSVCSCLHIPTPTTTRTVYTTKARKVSVVSTTKRVTLQTSSVSTTTQITTLISTNTNLATTTSTTTQTYYAVATTIVPNGLAYRKYDHTYEAGYSNDFSSSYFKTATPDFSGIQASLQFSTPSWPFGPTVLTLSDGQTFESTHTALLLQGFFIASQTGTYTFTSSGDYIDNWGYLWTGDVAYSAWDDSNTEYQASRTEAAYIGGSSTLTMNAGDAVPLTWLWANGNGVAQSAFAVTLPDGSSTTDTSQYLVGACSAGTFT